MVRMSKQGKRRAMFPRKTKSPSKKTGPLTENLPKGYKEVENALEGDLAKELFVSKVK